MARITTNQPNFEYCPAVILEKNKFSEKVDFPTFNDRISKIAFRLGAFADQYASLSKYEIHFLPNGQLQTLDVKGYAWKTALKVMSYFLIILPIIALVVKKIYKDYCENYVHAQRAGLKNQLPIHTQEASVAQTPQELPSQNLTLNPVIEQPTPNSIVNVQKPQEVNQRVKTYQLGKTAVSLVEGDVTQDRSEVLVNAANRNLRAGSGVCGAFYDKAGAVIFTECKAIILKMCVDAIPVGHVAVTTSGALAQSKAILHAVGPYGSDANRKVLMANVIENCLKAAAGIDVNDQYRSDTLPKNIHYRSIAIPPISTGIFGYPIKEASEVAAQTVKAFVAQYPDAFDEINFVFFPLEKDNRKTRGIYQETFDVQFV